MNLLLVTARYPWPPRRGDQLRAAQMVELLAPAHRLTVLAPAPPAEAPPAEAPPAGCRLITYRQTGLPGRLRALVAAAAGGRPLQAGLYAHRDLAHRIALEAPGHDAAILQMVRLEPCADALGQTPLVADLIDSLSLNFARRARLDRPWLAPLWRTEAKRLLAAERRLIARSARALVVCERDRRHLVEALPAELGERLAVLPLAVTGRPPGGEVPASGAQRSAGPQVQTLILTGNLGYFPTADAARWLLRRVWPRLAGRHGRLRLVLAGARPGGALSRAASARGVEVVPSPPDLAPLLAGATLALAPMRCGSGQPLKVLEAWAAGVPVVASPWAAAGTTAVAGRDLAVADGPEAWAAEIERLLDDGAARDALAAAGRRRLEEDYAPAAVEARLGALLSELGPRRGLDSVGADA